MQKVLFNINGRQRRAANKIALYSSILVLTIASVFLFCANKIEYLNSIKNLETIKNQQVISQSSYYTKRLVDIIDRYRISHQEEKVDKWSQPQSLRLIFQLKV